ncbi:hypothetical protein GL213_06135 [Halogeometricum borinquense]|uniref:Uncharacterized protein n=1 Tax=Halogeometricum borinquense TaxID=60847 RepID=A0A6C0UI29_9EURY|nr:hypothetical protein [Halogeometricum borinquense]QIB74867.1 hypothetical protein G3I44_11605 [Halogeometricum borinquense]QIQ76134.1 hypothetical protein GL213_06135 [Halogeometricum borinquense]
MGNNSFTLFEIHLHDTPNIGPQLFGKGSKGEDESEGTEEYHSIEVHDEEETESAGSSRGIGGMAIVSFVLLIALAIAVKVLSGGDDDLDELDDLSDVSVESE